MCISADTDVEANILVHPYKKNNNFQMTHQNMNKMKVKIFLFLLLCSASLNKAEVVSQETHKEEMDKLKLEIQQCKDFIQTQQQLLQVSEKLPE